MLTIDLTGKRAFVAGVADDLGFGFSIAKMLAEAGATVCVGTWPPAYNIFTKLIESNRIADSLVLSDGGKFEFERIYALDAEYDTLADVPVELRENRRYKAHPDFTIQGVADRLVDEFGEHPLDIVVHSLANASEVKNPLLATSRGGYLQAVSASAYSFVSLVQRFGPLLRSGGTFLNLSYLAGERVVPGYGGGMSSAKAALESDTRTLAYEAGRKWGIRVNCISAGPWASRAASSIGFISEMIEHCRDNSPLGESIDPQDVATTVCFLASPLASAITGATIYVDKGYNVMGAPAGVPDQPERA
ncbi:MAG: enoyl-[acyl-carrier-protein] reductase [Deltaproteobacteria bacterium]|nr:enoyl-[acyl-carrier-protein] reductase [Deltaproteobacteria bacterium]MBW2414768.1 enoyl-[acyl-carrier-protein] reductase [Deltaproteobacteria bacterium]